MIKFKSGTLSLYSCAVKWAVALEKRVVTTGQVIKYRRRRQNYCHAIFQQVSGGMRRYQPPVPTTGTVDCTVHAVKVFKYGLKRTTEYRPAYTHCMGPCSPFSQRFSRYLLIDLVNENLH